MAASPLGFKTFKGIPGIYVTEDAVTDKSQDVANPFRVVMVYWENKADVEVTLEQLWDPTDTQHRGVLCFMPKLPHDWDQFYEQISKKYLNHDARFRARYLLWIEDPDFYSTEIPVTQEIQVNNNPPRVNQIVYLSANDIDFPVLNGTFVINKARSLSEVQHVELNESKDGLKVVGPLHLKPAIGSADPVVVPQLDLVLTFEEQGNFVFDVALDNAGLQGVDSGLRYFWKDTSGAEQSQRYPVFDPSSNPSGMPQSVPFTAHLDPWFAYDPFVEGNLVDPRRNYYLFGTQPDQSQPPVLGSYLRTSLGRKLSLVPTESANSAGEQSKLLFYASPSKDGQPVPKLVGSQPVYLLPVGRYTLSADVDTAHVLCGVAATEFFLMKPGDALDFVPGQPAFAESFHAADPTKSDLDDTYTTAWLRVAPKAPSGLVPSYCVQALDYLYFGKSVADLPYPVAVGCQMASLADPATTNLVPMVPYSGVDISDAAQKPTFTAFERLVIATKRRAQLKPKFDYKYGPKYFDLESNEPFDGGTIRTAKGFLASLNSKGSDPPGGTCNELKLAKSPEHSALYNDPIKGFLRFQSGNNPSAATAPSQDVVSPLLSNALEDDNLFLVAASTEKTSTGNPFGKFANEISIGEFIFQLDTSAFESSQATGGVVMIFKFATGVTVESLVNDTSTWAETDVFLGEDIATTQESLQGWIKTAKEAATGTNTELHAYYSDIYRKLTDPEWTGILSFNCPLPYGQLTTDLQMLLGGISGRLQAFHFGITANRLKGEAGSGGINNSSLFGLIYHHEELDKSHAQENQLHFQVPELNALFINSALALFESKVAMTIPHLYGDQVALTHGTKEDVTSSNDTPAGIMVIDGSYQKNARGGEGAVVFDSTQARTFDYTALPSKFGPPGLRAISKVNTSDAGLVPVTPDTQLPGSTSSCLPSGQADTILKSAFRLSGHLVFNSDLGDGTDLFSYKDDPGLSFSAYPFNMWTMIQGNTACLATIEVDPTEVLVDESNSPLRPNSLIGTLPTTLNRLRYDVAGITASSLGGWQVTQESGGVLESSGSTEYVLDFTLPLGTLGDLVSSTDKLFSSLILGWQPSGSTISGDNKISLVLVLPEQMGGTHGSFKYQGIMEMDFEAVQLGTVPVPSPPTPPSSTLYVLKLTNVKTLLFGFAILGPDQKRSIIFFGNPKGPHTLDLMWYLDDLKFFETDVKTFLSFTPFVGGAQGLDVTLPSTQLKGVGPAITALTVIPETAQGVVATIWNPDDEPSGDTTTIKADPDAGALFFLSIFFMPLTLQVLLDDPSFYGGRIALGAPPKPKKGQPQDGEKGSSGPLATFGGLEFEIIYRRINDHLGALSVDFVLPDKFRIIYFGAKDNPETPVLTLPEIGVEVFIPNGDWKISIGWPFTSTTTFFAAKQLSLKVPIEDVPILFSLGFFVAKLRSEDIGIGDFDLIWEFGVGLSGGPSIEGEAAGGILKWSVDLYVFSSVQGFLGSCKGNITDSGADYHWYAINAGVTLSLFGKLDLKIISAEITVEASLVITVAWETDHSTHLLVEAQVKVDLKVKVVFFSIRFRMSIDVKVLDAAFGDPNEPVAQISGPTPQKLYCSTGVSPTTLEAAAVASPQPLAASFGQASDIGQPSVGMAESGSASDRPLPTSAKFAVSGPQAARAELAGAAAPQPIAAYFALQPTVTFDPAAKPQAVASFLIEAPGESDHTATTPFTILAKGIAAWMQEHYGGSGNASQQVANMQAKINDGTFHKDVVTCLQDSVVFELATSHPTSVTTVAALPAFPQLGVKYNGSVTNFDSKRVSADYEQAVQKYFGNASAAAQPSPLDNSVAGIVFVDYFVMLARQMTGGLKTLIDADSSLSVEQALAPDKFDYGNVAGIVTRFLKHGLRLPYPDPNVAEPTLYPLFVLTGQQFSLDPKVLDADLVPGAEAPPLWIKLGGKGTDPVPASLDKSLVITQSWNGKPPWSAAAMDATVAVQQRFILNKKFSWSDAKKVIRALPEALQAEAGLRSGLRITTEIPPSNPQEAPKPGPNSAPVLKVPVTIRKVPIAGQPGTFVQHVYQMVGAGEADREQLQSLLDAVKAGSTSIAAVSLLSAPSAGTYSTVAVGSDTVLVKTDLATEAVAPTQEVEQQGAAVSDECVDSASPTSGLNFLRLIWEVSIVHRAGFFLYEKSIPESIFDGNSATLTLLIELDGSAARPVTIQSYHNSILIAEADDPDAVRVEVSDTSGNPVEVYHPNIPAGSVGYKLTWANAPKVATAADSTAFIEQLYHIVSSRVATAIEGVSNNWSPPVSGHEPQPNEPQGNWFYRSTKPIYGSGQNRYTNVGKQVEIDLSVVDVFGNALPDSLNQKVAPQIVYNDPLVSIDKWSGTQFTYLITGPDSGKVTLTINTTFTTDTFTAEPANPTSQEQAHARQALATYERLKDQLADGNVTLSVQPYFIDSEGSKLGLWGAPLVKDVHGGTVQIKLAAFVDSAVGWLSAIVGGTTPRSAPAATSLEMSIDAGYVADPQNINVDLFPLTVRIAIDRKNVDAVIAEQIAAAASVSHGVPPLQDPDASDPAGNALRTFATDFETAYTNYDGQNGMLKLAQGTNLHENASAKSGTRALWVTRWGPKGMTVSFADKPTYFAPTPLSTQLLTGSFKVRDYKMSGWTGGKDDYTTAEHQFNDIDLDAWAAEFLASFDEVLSPQTVVGIPTLPNDPYPALIDSKATLAQQLSVNTGGSAGYRLATVVQDPPDAGEVKAAAEMLQEALLSDLSSDYSLSAIVQVPAKVGIQGSVEPDASAKYPPNVFGKVTSADETANSPYTISPTKLPLVSGNETASILVSAKKPGAQEELPLDLSYNIGFLEHDFETAEKACGYVPSSWLTFVLPKNGPLLTPSIGPVHVPIPLRSFPPPPVLVSQAARQQKQQPKPSNGTSQPDDPANYMQWKYVMTVGRPKAEQDDLLLDVTFNEPLAAEEGGGDTTLVDTVEDTDRDAPADLFEALAQFHYEWPAIRAQLASVSPASRDETVAVAAIQRFQELVDGVTGTLPSWSNPALTAADSDVHSGDTNQEPPLIIWRYRVVFHQEDLPAGDLRVTRIPPKGTEPSTYPWPWPDIEGYTTPNSSAATADYKLKPSGSSSGPIQLTWNDLYVLSHQSVRGSAAVERNVDIVAKSETTNPAFVYRTAEVVFPNVLTPQIEVPYPITWNSDNNVCTAVGDLFGDIFKKADSHVDDKLPLHFDLVTGYEYELVATADAKIVSRGPVYLVQPQDLTLGGLDGFESGLSGALISWRDAAKPSEDGAFLSFALTFFAADSISAGSLVLVDFADLRIPIPDPAKQPGWWSK